MKNKTLISLLFLGLISFNVDAQSFMKGTKTVNLGVGVGYGLGVLASAEVGVTDAISAGIVVGGSRRSYFGYGVTYVVAGARASYHFGKILSDAGVNVDKLDPYLGLTGGFRSVKYDNSWGGYSGAGTGLMLGGYAGVRYQLKESLGVFVEGGSPLSSAGITFKF